MKKKLLEWKLLYSRPTQTQTQSRTPILFYTDSQLLCEALSSCNPGTSSIRPCISSISSSIFLQWVPGYSNIHPWQWPRRQSSERSNRNRDRYNPPRTTFMCVSYHQSTADKKPQRWCTNHSTPLRNSPITKCPLSLDWPWNWSYVSIMSSSRALRQVMKNFTKFLQLSCSNFKLKLYERL